MLIFSSIGGSYLENNIIQKLNLNFPILNQSGLSDWLLLNFSRKISNIMSVNVFTSKSFLGLTSLFITIVLFAWISSIGSEEKNF